MSYNNRRGNYSRYNNNNNSYNNRNWRNSLNADESRLVNQGKDDLFDKKKTFSPITSLKDHSLLLKENLFITDKWDIEELLQLKKKLNNTRNRLNEKDIKVWKQHTQKTNMTGRIVWPLREKNHIEMCTNAWIKMAEIFSKYENLIPKDLADNQPFRSVHICEAPGAFICATNFYFNKYNENRHPRSPRRQWEWTGLSLNPYYEGNDQEAMVDDDRFIIETLDKWYFGKDNSGNILDKENIHGLWEKIRANSSSSGVHLVTGDGSVDTSGDPNEQESIVSELHYTEAICALGALVKGGSLVLKMFNLFECDTICLLYVLALHFKELSIFKPASSRSPNAETYVVALGFRGIDPVVLESLLSFVSATFPFGKALLSRDLIPQSFLNELTQFADYFTMKQIQAIERNLELEKIWNRNIQQAIFQLNEDVVKEFRRVCFIDYNYQQRIRIVQNVELDGSAKALGNSGSIVKGGLRQRSGGTLNDRQNRKRTREEFLSSSSNNNDNDNVLNETEEERQNKRQNLGQGKSVTIGSKNLTTTMSNETDIDSPNNQLEEKESVAMKLMKKSGFIEGQGLGIHNQGRSTAVEISLRDTRLGLGHHNQLPITSSSFSPLDIPKVFDEPLFSDYDKSESRNLSFPLLYEKKTTIAPGLKSILSSLYIKFDDLELLYKTREEYFNKIENNEKFKNIKIFLSDQLELLNSEEIYRNTHGFFINYQIAFQLASLDKVFNLTSIKIDNSTHLSFIIENSTLTGFAEYLIWQQQDDLNGFIISDEKYVFPFNSSIQYKLNIDFIPSKVHLFFSDLTILPLNPKINQRYLEIYNKKQMLISCRNALNKLNENGHFVFCQELKYPVNKSIIQYLENLLQHNQTENILEVISVKCLIHQELQQYIHSTVQRLLQREIQALQKRLYFINQSNHQQINSMLKDEDLKKAHEYITVQRRSRILCVEPDSGIKLPSGWTKEWSKKEERHYYFNINTGESRWEPPN
ncbi:unnamed protein product [Adineta steineri]|uniref:Cap-specific mRNA (nucleoside-2'-O-)-methyltransferase 1 n=1 Tax=Adineta steineri TaxID=433720 RepID=A0A815GQ45_9BILA|nr:unnamed protein product [Adineta steineri]CAF3485002.1 unnamed protein product [Adineta steineri]